MALLYPVERHRIANLMIERVDLVAGGLRVKWHAMADSLCALICQTKTRLLLCKRV